MTITTQENLRAIDNAASNLLILATELRRQADSFDERATKLQNAHTDLVAELDTEE